MIRRYKPRGSLSEEMRERQREQDREYWRRMTPQQKARKNAGRRRRRAIKKANGVYQAERYSEPWRARASVMLCSAKSRAKRKGIEFNLTVDHVMHMLETQGYLCSMTGLPLELTAESAEKNAWIPSLDRINNNLGYTWDNTRLVAHIVNVALNTFGRQDLLIMAEALLRNKRT